MCMSWPPMVSHNNSFKPRLLRDPVIQGVLMKAPRLKALEKNVLKYRALQMILMLHEFESLKRYVINSIRFTDSMMRPDHPRVPLGCKKPLELALDVLVESNIISGAEKSHIKE